MGTIYLQDYIFPFYNFKFEAIEYNLTLHFKCLVGQWEEFGRAKTSADSNNGKNLVEFKINPPILITVLLVYCGTITYQLTSAQKEDYSKQERL